MLISNLENCYCCCCCCCFVVVAVAAAAVFALLLTLLVVVIVDMSITCQLNSGYPTSNPEESVSITRYDCYCHSVIAGVAAVVAVACCFIVIVTVIVIFQLKR